MNFQPPAEIQSSRSVLAQEQLQNAHRALRPRLMIQVAAVPRIAQALREGRRWCQGRSLGVARDAEKRLRQPAGAREHEQPVRCKHAQALTREIRQRNVLHCPRRHGPRLHLHPRGLRPRRRDLPMQAAARKRKRLRLKLLAWIESRESEAASNGSCLHPRWPGTSGQRCDSISLDVTRRCEVAKLAEDKAG